MSVTNQVDLTMIAVKAALNGLHDEGRTWRQIAAIVGTSHASVHQVAHAKFEHVSWETIRQMAVKLGGSDPGALTFVLDGKHLDAVPPCASCGGVHIAEDCQGRPVADVVCVAPGYHVAKVRGRPIPRRLSDYPPAVLAYLLTHREPMA